MSVNWSECVSGSYLNVPAEITLEDLVALEEPMLAVAHINAPLCQATDEIWDLLLSQTRFPNAAALIVYESTFGSAQVPLLSRFAGLKHLNAEGCRNLSVSDHAELDRLFEGRPKRY